MFALTKNEGVPAGVIVFYKGSLATIPKGWHLCDGTAGTDDLRDKIVICAGLTYLVDDTGGATGHCHTDNFIVGADDSSIEVMEGDGAEPQASGHDHSILGSVLDANNMMPYVAKGYIQKL